MTQKQFIKNFVLKQFHCSDYFFESAWKHIEASYRKLTNLNAWRGSLYVLYDKTRTDKEYDAVKTISILYEAIKEIEKTGKAGQFLKALEEASKRHRAEEELRLKILKNLESTAFEVRDFIKTGMRKPSGQNMEYEEKIDLKDENYLFNLLELEIRYINDEIKVFFKLLGKNETAPKAEEEIKEFRGSERNFAFMLRLAVAMMANEEGKEGWLDKYHKLYIKFEPKKFNRDRELVEFRKFLSNCEAPFLNEIAKSKGWDKEEIREFKKSLIRSSETRYPRSIRLAINNKRIKIDKITIQNLKHFKCKFISAKTLIKLPRLIIARIRGQYDEAGWKEKSDIQYDGTLEQIPVADVVEALIRDACKVYDKYIGKSHQKSSKPAKQNL